MTGPAARPRRTLREGTTVLRTIKTHPTAAFVVLTLLLIGTVLAVAARLAPTARAADDLDFGAGTVRGALVRISADSPRGEYVDANGVHHCLPSGPHAVHGQAGDYPDMWFAVADPGCDFGTSSTTSPSTGSAVEKAPVLASGGAATATTARLKWSDAVADAGETITAYVVQYRLAGSTWGAAPGSPAASSPLTVVGLDANTGYEFRVQAEYRSGARGPWSNVLTVRTPSATAASTTS